jgi:hypothetical protein
MDSVTGEDINDDAPKPQSENISFSGEFMQELDYTMEVVTKLELDISRSSEKMVNMNILMMHVATKENEFEALVSDKERNSTDSAEMALEFDLMSGILDSEVKELKSFMSTLQTQIADTREFIHSYENMGDVFREIEEMVRDSEESLNQSFEQVKEIRAQCDDFQRTLLSFNGESNGEEKKSVEFSGSGGISDSSAKLKMQTAEQQRHILRMLEKSLAKELELEKMAVESKQREEDLKTRLHSSEEETYNMEEEFMAISERLFEAENIGQVLMGTSKELLGRIHILQFNLNGSCKREIELKNKLSNYMEQVTTEESILQRLGSSTAKVNDFIVAQNETLKSSLAEARNKIVLADSENLTLRERVNFLEKQLRGPDSDTMSSTRTSMDGTVDIYSEIVEMTNSIEDLKEKKSKAEKKVESAERIIKLLTDNNMELTEELNNLKNSSVAADERADSLELRLKESDTELSHAVATFEANMEKQSMLKTTINDMENLIKDLKLKVSKTEHQLESTEEKCIILSETNSDLTAEIYSFRSRIECLEAALHKEEEYKKSTAKDISLRTKLITDLVMQLALERERLQKQISSLRKENRIFVNHVQKTNKNPDTKQSNEVSAELSALSSELDKTSKVGVEQEIESNLETVTNIDPSELNFRHILMAIFFIIVSAVAVLLFNQWNSQV